MYSRCAIGETYLCRQIRQPREMNRTNPDPTRDRDTFTEMSVSYHPQRRGGGAGVALFQPHAGGGGGGGGGGV